MKQLWFHWAPAILLGTGALFTVGINTQRDMPLRAPLAGVFPAQFEGYRSKDVEISAEEQRVAGMTDYLMRVYEPAGGSATAAYLSLYVGYYASQTQGRTIHSPKNCLPGAGWEALQSRSVQVATAGGSFAANQYLLQRKDERALVLYWYQGRGRTEANEYQVKWDLLRDAALRGRTEEALVRVVVPVSGSTEEAFELAARVAGQVMPVINSALPI